MQKKKVGGIYLCTNENRTEKENENTALKCDVKTKLLPLRTSKTLISSGDCDQ